MLITEPCEMVHSEELIYVYCAQIFNFFQMTHQV